METPRKFPAGIQTDIRQLEKVMIPVCAVVCQDIIRKHKFTPYIKGIGGYSMSLSSITNGGNLWGLDIGTRFQWGTKGSITFSIGYEYQDYKVLRRAQSGPFRVECIDHIGHNAFSIKLGGTLLTGTHGKGSAPSSIWEALLQDFFASAFLNSDQRPDRYQSPS